MTDLLPSLSSDDDDDPTISKKGHKHGTEADESDDDNESMCMDETFTFGTSFLNYDNHMNIVSSINHTTNISKGWSYQNIIQQHDQQSSSSIPRMDIDAIISAKRKDLLKHDNQNNTIDNKTHQSKNQQHDVDDDDDVNDDDSSESNRNSTLNDDDDDDDDESTNKSDDDDNVVDDAHLTHFEDDVIKTKIDSKIKKNTIHTDNTDSTTSNQNHDEDDDEKNNDDDLSVDDDDDNDDDDEEDDDDKREKLKADAFFDTKTSIAISSNSDHADNNTMNRIQDFNQLPICRPLLRGIAAMGFVQPTPIQAAVIPLVLRGRDICASAVTGSGKTAAFVVPIAERIIHRSTASYHCTRAVILTPTRELAAQCFAMMSSITTYTKLRASLIVGGTKNVAAQATELRTRPDFIIATPGRLLDHITNSIGITLDDLEFLILDEADRLLDLGFSDEIMEIVKACPVVRQTLLFSATMNTKVDDLIRLSLKNPVRVRITNQHIGNNNDSLSHGTSSIEVAPRLEQEFIRIRASNEGINREGILLALLTRTFKTQVICFFDTKVTAHRIMILAGLCGIRCTELHGNLSQPQRLMALEDFRAGNVDVLLATDLAARGLDIDRVQTVINFEMPSQLSTYVHRIGRTARAGRGGRSCTLIGESRRHLMKELMKESSKKHRDDASSSINNGTGIIRSRTVPLAVISHFAAKVQTLEPHYQEILQAEAVARLDRIAEMEVIRAKNLIEHADEIKQRPPREWFATVADKQRLAEKSTALSKESEHKTMNDSKNAVEKISGMHRMTRKKRRAREAREAALNHMDGNDSNDDDPQPKKIVQNIKSDVRKQKRLQAEMRNEKSDLSIHDLDVKENNRQTKLSKNKVVRDAAGDSDLFDDEKVSYSLKTRSQKAVDNVEQVAKSSYKFIGYNPDKKLGKKKAHKAFKSKSKHRRR